MRKKTQMKRKALLNKERNVLVMIPALSAITPLGIPRKGLGLMWVLNFVVSKAVLFFVDSIFSQRIAKFQIHPIVQNWFSEKQYRFSNCTLIQAKRVKEEVRACSASSASSTPLPSTSKDMPDLSSQLAMMGMMGLPFIGNPFVPVMNPEFFTNPLLAAQQSAAAALPHGNKFESKM